MKSVEIYGKDDCVFCKKALQLIKDNGYNYSYKNITDKILLKEMFEKNPDAKTIPQIFIVNYYVGGYNELKALINEEPQKFQSLIGE